MVIENTESAGVAGGGFKKAFLMDVDFVEVKGKPAIRLMLQSERNKKTFRVYDLTFEPYYYVMPRSESELPQAKQSLEKLQAYERGEKMAVKRVEETTRLHKFKPVRLLKVIAFHPGHVPKLREESARFGTVFEADIPFYKRYIIDKGLAPCGLVELKRDGFKALEVRQAETGEASRTVEFKTMALDIESYNPNVVPTPSKDPCLMIGYAGDGGFEGVYSFQKKFSKPSVKSFSTEKEMLEAFCELLREKHVDLLCTYNGDSFDLPYMQERAKQLKADFRLGRDRLPVKTKRIGMRTVSEIGGRIHYDVLPVASFMNFTGTIKVPRLTLEKVYAEVLGGKKLDFDAAQTWRVWDSNDGAKLDFMAEYCTVDARACLELAKHFLYLQTELSKLLHMTLFDVSRATASQLVETFLLRKAFERNELVPNKPSGSEIAAREREPVQGAFVKMPFPGVYDNIAVFDFRSLYPSIIISHNVDATTFNCDCCTREEGFISPQGHKFCAKHKGIIPEVLSSVLSERIKIKSALKNTPRDSHEYQLLYARQWGLKIFANSVYGLTLHPRFRWYSRAAGESTTAWARHYIQDAMRKAEEEDFRVLYGDSVTAERFLVLLDDKGFIQIENVEKFFEEQAERKGFETFGEKQVTVLNGWKCLSVDPATKKTEWKKINELIRHRSNKKIYRVNQKFGETRVTEDHSLMADTPEGLVEVKPLNAGKFKLAKAEMLESNKKIVEIDVFEVLKHYFQEVVYKGRKKRKQAKCDSKHVWFNWTERRNPVKVKRFIRTGTKEFEALCRLLAAYAAEGSSSTIETTRSRLGASIAGSRQWLEPLKNDYELLFSNAKTCIIRSTKKTRHLTYCTGKGVSKSIIYEDDTHKLQMMNSLSAVFFKMFCGQKSAGKKLPDFIYNVSRENQLIFLKKILEGDGSRSVNERLGYSEEYKRKNFSYTTISVGLASGLSVLLKQLGINHSIQYRPEKKAYTLKTSDKFNERIRTKVVEEAYEGWVYDLSVEDNHTFVDACGQIVLHNTDSIMILFSHGEEEKLKEFQRKINKELPERMELELEGFYPRGIFVSKKQDAEKGAKKKYALIDAEGRIKIRGFELVRRDWSRVARHTQRTVLEILLKEGDVQKAVDFVRDVVTKLKSGETPLEDCVIYTQLQKSTGSYEVKSPELGAVLKARKAGMIVPEGAVVGYVISRQGKTISEKAILAEQAKDYDSDYYVNNQVMPAVLKIMGALGISEDDIKLKGNQSKLGGW